MDGRIFPRAFMVYWGKWFVCLLVFSLGGFFGQLHFASPAVAQKREQRDLEAQQVPASQAVPPKAQIRRLKTDPTNTFKLYAATADGLQVSENAGLSWAPMAIDGKHEEIFALGVHPARANTLFVGRRDGLWRSQDGGKSWHPLPYPESVPLSIAVAKSQPDTLYLATSRRGVHKSSDGGYQWTEINKGLPEARAGGRPEEIHTLVVNPLDSNVAYAGLSRHGIYRTMDGGASWHAFNQNLAISVTQAAFPPKLAFDPDDPKHPYLVLNQRIHSHLLRTGLYVLSDSQEWLPVEAKLPANFPILDLAVDRSKHTLQLWGTDAVWELPLLRMGQR